MITYAKYMERKCVLATYDNTPTETDQSGADDTDVNVIVKRYGVYGAVPQGKTPPKFGEDFSQLPDDLRGFIETARSLNDRQQELPPQLQNLTVDELLSYTPEALVQLLKPEEKPAEETK